jgi:hypothetical protein
MKLGIRLKDWQDLIRIRLHFIKNTRNPKLGGKWGGEVKLEFGPLLFLLCTVFIPVLAKLGPNNPTSLMYVGYHHKDNITATVNQHPPAHTIHWMHPLITQLWMNLN